MRVIRIVLFSALEILQFFLLTILQVLLISNYKRKLIKLIPLLRILHKHP